MSVPKRGADAFYALRLSRLLHLPFRRWKAYELGIIDINGNKLKDAETSYEKSNWTMFHVTIRNIKRMIHKVPGGQSLLDYGASYLLLIELQKEYGLSDEFLEQIGEVNIMEAVVAGDSGGDPDAIASGETTGAVTNIGPEVLGKKKKKKRVTRFRNFDEK